MSQSETPEKPNVALVDYPPEEVPSLQKDIPEINWVQKQNLPAPDSDSLDAIVVNARHHDEDHALSLCQEIRDDNRYDGIPVLVAISIYQMPLGNNVKKLPNAHFLFVPLDKEELFERLEEMNVA
jgi:hypothetical protein